MDEARGAAAPNLAEVAPSALSAVSELPQLPLESYRLAVESIQDYAIFLLGPAGHIATWNLGARRIKGYRPDEIIGQHFSVFYLPEDVASGMPERELQIVREQGRLEAEGFRLRKDGTRFWASVVITALHDETGAFRGYSKVTRDLSERRRVEEELHRSEERLRHLIEAVGDYAIYMLDPAGNVATWNSGAQNIKGYAAAEIVGQHFSRFFTAEDVAAGRPQRELETAATEGRFEEEGWRVRKDGSRFWANVVLTRLRDARGTPLGFAKVTRDLTAKRAAEQTARELVKEQTARTIAEQTENALRQERERYKALSRRLEVILDGIAEGITVQDRSGRSTFANAAAARLCGFETVQEFLSASPAEVVSRFDVLDEHGEPMALESLPGRQVLAGADSASATMQVRERATGRQWWSSVRAKAVKAPDGTVELAVNIWHDVTAERRREEHERYIADATAKLSSSLDYQAMLSALAALLVPGLADWCSIHVLEGDRLENVAVAHIDPAKVAVAREYQEKYPPLPTQTSGLWNVVRSGAPELYEEISDELLARGARDAAQLEALRSVGMKSVVLAPIRIRDRVTGTLSLISAESARRYTRDDVALAVELGRRAGSAIENARLYAAEKQAREQLELLARAGEAFSGTFDYEETLRRVVEIALPLLGDFAFFDVVEGDAVRRVAAAHHDAEVERLLQQTRWVRSERKDKNLCALSHGVSGLHPVVDDAWMQDVATSPEHLGLLRALELRSMLTVPLRARGELLGALTLCFGKSRRRHTVEDLSLAEELARRAALALVQVRLYDDAKRAAADAAEAAQRAERANRIKDEFLATVSHELRTPLNAIVGWSSLLRARSTDPAVSKGIEVIHRNAQAQGKIVEDILDVSRIITGKLRLDLKPADLVQIVQDAVEVIRPSATAKRIAVVFEPATDVSVVVVDRERLQQVVWNLLSNAVKFTDADGAITISLRQNGSNVIVGVSDTGRGIELEFLPYVFDRFKQADSSTTRRYGGLGLGLSIVRHIVELHGGHATAASAGPGRGSTFEITLPIRAVRPDTERVDRASSRPADAERASIDVQLSGVRVVVVDDEPDARELLQTVLEQAGAIVETAGSVAAGFLAVQRFNPHIIVSDIGMPHEDGYSFVRRLRALEASRGIPAIALSAYTRGEDKTKALAAGFTTHLAKPVDPSDLVSTVASLAVSPHR